MVRFEEIDILKIILKIHIFIMFTFFVRSGCGSRLGIDLMDWVCIYIYINIVPSIPSIYI